MARERQPEHADCRAVRPKFDKGAWSRAKISDVTDGGLYLLVTPDNSRLGHAASKLWRMGYRTTYFGMGKSSPILSDYLTPGRPRKNEGGPVHCEQASARLFG